MEFDEIVVGSGLVALAAVIGISPGRRVLVLGGADPGRSLFYDNTRSVPCAHLGFGGLGNYWHGVIPTAGTGHLEHGSPAEFVRLFQRFYPRVDVAGRLGKPWLFVPWRPIRPRSEWARLQTERADELVFVPELVSRFEIKDQGVLVHTNHARYHGRRLWICAGVLHTPALLDRSLRVTVSRPLVSDHVICYMGQIDRAVNAEVAAPAVQRTREGLWFEAHYNEACTGLYTVKPARFAFSRLDHGIEQRAAFGLPTGGALAKIMKAASAGLIAEALYNRVGLFPNARVQSVYAQIVVPDAHRLDSSDLPLQTRWDAVGAIVDTVRADRLWRGLTESKRLDIFIPGIHLHHSVDPAALSAVGVNTPASCVQVTDASVQADIGPEHHTFKLMVAAAERSHRLTTD